MILPPESKQVQIPPPALQPTVIRRGANPNTNPTYTHAIIWVKIAGEGEGMEEWGRTYQSAEWESPFHATAVSLRCAAAAGHAIHSQDGRQLQTCAESSTPLSRQYWVDETPSAVSYETFLTLFWRLSSFLLSLSPLGRGRPTVRGARLHLSTSTQRTRAASHPRSGRAQDSAPSGAAPSPRPMRWLESGGREDGDAFSVGKGRRQGSGRWSGCV